MKRLILFIILIFSLTGCGKKGALIAPEALVPAAVSDLQVAQKGEFFQLSWTLPTREAGGARLVGLAGFQLFRRLVLPPAQDCEQCPNAYHLLKAVDLDYLQDVGRFGNLFLLNDNGVETGKTYQYKMIALKKDGTPGQESNRARRQKVKPPLPAVLQAKSGPTGTTLELAPPPPDPEVELLGYNLYRWRDGEQSPPLPLNEQPVTGTPYEDLRLLRGITYHYVARTVAKVSGERVESVPSNEVSGTLTDPD